MVFIWDLLTFVVIIEGYKKIGKFKNFIKGSGSEENIRINSPVCKWSVCYFNIQQCKIHTVCPRSSDQFYIVSYDIKWITTSWTYSIWRISLKRIRIQFLWGLDPDPIHLDPDPQPCKWSICCFNNARCLRQIGYVSETAE